MALSNLESYYHQSVEELSEPIRAKVIGDIPTWVSGTLLRNGPGKFEVGDTAYRHVYDGLALLQQFVVEDGKVTYFNRFLRSQTYQTNMKAGKIVEGELGTPSVPDPCKNIFSRWFTYFFPKDYTDNASVNFCCIQGKIYALTEVPIVTEIDPSSLETLNRVNLSDAFRGTSARQIFSATAHPLEDQAGYIYNLSLGYKKEIGLSYLITKLPRVIEESGVVGKPVQCGEIVAAIPASYHHSYSHSFGMTQQYFIFIQQPLTVNLWKFGVSRFLRCSILDTFSWCPSEPTIFHVISRATGTVVATFTADTFFFFHIVNAYDMSGNIIIDICCYQDPSILYEFYAEEYRRPAHYYNVTGDLSCYLHRYTLPIEEVRRDLATASGTCNHRIPEQITGDDFEILCGVPMELPRINEKYNMLPYRFVYGVSRDTSAEHSLALLKLVKVDVKDRTATIWSEDDCIASEPVFIAAPDSQQEDDGVVLSAVYDSKNAESFLLVLDGRTFTEIGRAQVQLRVAQTTHGVFLPNGKSFM